MLSAANPLLLLLLPGLLFFTVSLLITLHNRRHFIGLQQVYRHAESITATGQPESSAQSASVLPAESSPTDTSARPDEAAQQHYPSKVSILIPARNEEQTIGRLMRSLAEQRIENMEVWLLDDQSEDATAETAEHAFSGAPFPLHIIHGNERPQGWLGKNWACHQLAAQATGDYLVFLDADTWLAPDAIKELIDSMNHFKLDFATVWPHQIMGSFAEKTVISMVYSAIPSLLPVLYNYQPPGWIPGRTLREKTRPMFAAACGQCIAFRRSAYELSGGHEAVFDQVVEDVKIAKHVVQNGLTMRMFHGTDRIWCRMYNNHHDLFQGFRKNFFAGFNYRFIPFSLAWFLHILAYLLPPVVLFAGLFAPGVSPHLTFEATALAALATSLPFFIREIIRRYLKWPLSVSLLHLPGVLWFQWLAVVVVADRLSGAPVSWKGRVVR